MYCPFDPHLKLMAKQGETFSDPERYRRLDRKLIYLTITSSDLSFVVGVVSQFMQNYCIDRLIAHHPYSKLSQKAPGQGLFYGDKGIPKFLDIMMLIGLVLLWLTLHYKILCFLWKKYYLLEKQETKCCCLINCCNRV